MIYAEEYERFLDATRRKRTALFLTLREAIASGRFPAGSRLPSTRQIAETLGVARGTVNEAYDMLYAAGLVRGEQGKGTFVVFASTDPQPPVSGAGKPEAVRLSAWAGRLLPVPDRSSWPEYRHTGNTGEEIGFIIGRMDEQALPGERWKTFMYTEIREAGRKQRRDAFAAGGHGPLREAIADELRRERGIHADPRAIVLTNGSMQAIALLTMLLIEPGDPVAVERPCYDGIVRAVLAAGGIAVEAEVDRDGIVPCDWAAKLLFVTPSRQFPTGAVLPPVRRKQLLEWAIRREAVIVEDDYDSEFRWGSRPSEPLRAMDATGRVVYLGTFSKTMYPDLRIGYAVLPDSLIEPFLRAKFLLEPHPTGIAEQRALAAFMASGQYGKHLRKARRIYGRRLAALSRELDRRLPHLFERERSGAGLHLFVRWKKEPELYSRFREACARAGVTWTDGAVYWTGGPPQPSALLGFAHLPEERIVLGVRRMEEVWRRM
ncbi:PLP-dependent aminotransferase family protein [Paenibacillus cisolokensis]|uniref:MocR-like pyridoxine biosynthesis transcription factor PdxR n=1 Tax=Paenibacillus cisolokensis TaxID=1658519 RepID=UPI003D2A411C